MIALICQPLAALGATDCGDYDKKLRDYGDQQPDSYTPIRLDWCATQPNCASDEDCSYVVLVGSLTVKVPVPCDQSTHHCTGDVGRCPVVIDYGQRGHVDYAPQDPLGETPFNCLAHAKGNDVTWINPLGPPEGAPAPSDCYATMDDILRDDGCSRLPCADHQEATQCGAGMSLVWLTYDSQHAWTHAMRRDPDGTWSSKDGQCSLFTRIADPFGFLHQAYGLDQEPECACCPTIYAPAGPQMCQTPTTPPQSCTVDTECFDFNGCTVDEECNDGLCSSHQLADGSPCSDDGDPCTIDSCSNATCVHQPSSLLCGGGTIWGDPHLVTFDGVSYDFQAVGEFILSRSLDGSFEVQTRTAPWNGSTVVSVSTAMAMNVAGDRVGLYLSPALTVRINGEQVSAPETRVDLMHGGSITAAGGGYLVRWPTGPQVTISVGSNYLDASLENIDLLLGNSLEGLLGNLDGITGNDVVIRSGGPPTAQEIYTQYADSWRVSQTNSLFDYAPGETTDTFTNRNFPTSVVNSSVLSEGVRAHAEEVCRTNGVTDPVLLEACILDVGLTGDSSFSSSASAVPPPITSLLPLNVSIYPLSGVSEGPGGLTFTSLVASFPASSVDFGTSTGFNWHPFGLADFGADIAGEIAVTAPGTYTFTVTSDDAAYIFIDGGLVVSEPNSHGPYSTSGSVALTAGVHSIEAQFYECCAGPSGIDLTLPAGVAYR